MNSTENTVLILGYGQMGHAMQALLGERNELLIWDRYPAKDLVNAVLEDAVPQADFILFCLPVNPHREVAELILPQLKPGAIAISIAKGLDESGLTAAQIFAGQFGAAKIAYSLLYGPMIAEELSNGRPGFAQLGSSSPAATARVQSLFAETMLFITPSDDIPGISWSVILKNVYAILFGIADGLALGDNVRGFLMAAAVHELGSITDSLGGKPGTARELAGLGDLVTTATSEHSHHHALGRRLARGELDNIECEGVHTLAMVERHALFEWSKFPLFSLVRCLVRQPEFAKQEILEFAARTFR